MNNPNKNQTLETIQLINNNIKNTAELKEPQTESSNIMVNSDNSLQFIPNINPPFNPNISSNVEINPTFTYVPTITINFDAGTKRKIRTLEPLKLGLEPKEMNCPFCEEKIETLTKKTINKKALFIAIGTVYIGLVLIQICKNKSISCEDCEHSCPCCRRKIGQYTAL